MRRSPVRACSSLVGVAVARRVARANASRPASCRTRTRATSSSTSSSRMPPRSSAPTTSASRSRRSSRTRPGVEYYTTVIGFSLLSRVTHHLQRLLLRHARSSGASARRRRSNTTRSSRHVNARARQSCPRRSPSRFPPPAIPGRRHVAAAFTFMLEDRSGKDVEFLAGRTSRSSSQPRRSARRLARRDTTFLPAVPQIFVNVDRDKVLKQGVSLSDVYQTMQAFMGGYVRQLLQPLRPPVAGLRRRPRATIAPTRRTSGSSTCATSEGDDGAARRRHHVETVSGPEFTMRYNLYRAAQINGSAAPGYSSGQAMKALEEVFAADHAARDGLRLHGHVATRRRRRSKASRRWSSSASRSSSCS